MLNQTGVMNGVVTAADLTIATLAAIQTQSLAFHLELDQVIGPSTKVPRFLYGDDYYEWKFRFEQYCKAKEPHVWRSIKNGPRTIMYATEDDPQTQIPKPENIFTNEDRKIVVDDDAAYGTLSMALGPDISIGVRNCKSAKEIWDTLVHLFEGNADMKASRVNMMNQQFSSFNHIYEETIENQIRRFVKLVSQMVSAGIDVSNSAINRQLLNSLPKGWDAEVSMIKRTKDLNALTLTELIATIKSCEIDNQQREINHKNSLMAAGVASPNNAALMAQAHPNLVFSPNHGIVNHNPNLVFSPIAAPKPNSCME
ncbi:hypothetical protein Hdeb2414_s0008g00291601 [Helianthus debilis subsp. tardiflorus]